MMQTGDLVRQIKRKKELSGIDDSMVLDVLSDYLIKNKLPLANLDKSQIKLVVKDIRSELRNSAGRFRAALKNRRRLLEKGDINSILRSHSSTRERMDFYPFLRRIIKNLGVKSILDLGCGINPLALAEPGIKYYASDVNREELDLIDKFFTRRRIDGRIFVCNLNKIDECALPKADLCLVFKVLDILGKEDCKTAEKIITRIKSRCIIVSFSTRTLSGKPMRHPRRLWFENLINSLGYSLEIFKSGNEIFYLVKKPMLKAP